MQKKNKDNDISLHYCRKTGDTVMLSSSKEKNGEKKTECLSSHLCGCDEKNVCEHFSCGGRNSNYF